MSDDTTTTDAPVQDTGADDAQPVQTDQAEAEQTQDTTTQSASGEGESQTNIEDLSKWASAKGLEINADNPNEVKLAQMQREAERKMHETTSQASELRNAVNREIEVEAAGLVGDEAVMAEIQQLKINQQINDFYSQNPDARKYDQAMAQLVNENPQLAAGGLEALYAVAKTREMQAGGEQQLKQQGGQEALKELASKQKVAAPQANATSYQTGSKVTLAEVGERTRAGDVAWLREHAAEIDAL